MCRYFVKDAGLLLAPMPRHPSEIVIADLAVQFVLIHQINAILELVVVGLKPVNRIIPLLPYVGMARPQRLAYLLKNPTVDLQLTEYFGELPLYDLLTHIFAPTRRYFATARITAAVVVGVFLLLSLAHDGAAAFGAFDELRVCENTHLVPKFGGIVGFEDGLDPLPNLRGNDGSMRTPVNVPVPLKPARIEPIVQN